MDELKEIDTKHKWDWFYFIICVFGTYACTSSALTTGSIKMWLGAVLFGYGSLTVVPSKSLRERVHKVSETVKTGGKALLGIGAFLLIVGLIIWAVIGIGGWIFGGGSSSYEGRTAEEWFNEYDAVEAENEDLRNALQEANDNIDTANTNIEDAQSYEGGSYEDMENALNNLSTVDKVDEP